MRLIDADKVYSYIIANINPYRKPFKGTAYEFGLNIMEYIKNLQPAYDVDKVAKQLEKIGNIKFCSFSKPLIVVEDAIEIVKAGGINDKN